MPPVPDYVFEVAADISSALTRGGLALVGTFALEVHAVKSSSPTYDEDALQEDAKQIVGEEVFGLHPHEHGRDEHLPLDVLILRQRYQKSEHKVRERAAPRQSSPFMHSQVLHVCCLHLRRRRLPGLHATGRDSKRGIAACTRIRGSKTACPQKPSHPA